MSNTIKIRRGSGVPDPSDFATYELAYDYTGNDLYVKVGSNMVKVNSEGSGTVTNVVAGNGLTGGGTTTATLDVVAGTGISVAANSVSTNDSQIVHDNLSGFVANEHIDHSTVSITAGNGLTGGGTIASSRTLNVVGENGLVASADAIGLDISTLTSIVAANVEDEDLLALEVALNGAIRKIALSDLKTYTQVITSVSGMTNNNILTASGSTTISGESNLTFDGDFKVTGNDSTFETISFDGSNGYLLLSGTASQRMEFRNTTTNANGWIGIPSWNTDAFYAYLPTASANELAYIYESSRHNLYNDVALQPTKKLYLDGGGNTYIDEVASGQLRLVAGGTEAIKFYSSGAIDMYGGSTTSRSINIGANRSGNGYSYIDLVGDATYSDFGARFIRENTGPNTGTSIEHRGTGVLSLNAKDAGSVRFYTSNTERVRVDSSGNVSIGGMSAGAKLDVNGIGHIRTAVFSDAFKPYSGTLATYGSSSSTDHYFVGDVGIGTNSPANKVHILGDANNAALRVQRGDNTGQNLYFRGYQIYNAGNHLLVSAADTKELRFGHVSSTAQLVLDSSGNISTGVWQGTPIANAYIADNSINAAKLDVSGNGSNGQVLKSNGDGTFSWFTLVSSSNASTLDNLDSTQFLRSDADDTASGQYNFTKVNDHAIKVGTIRGTTVGSGNGSQYIHLYERVHIGSPSGWGSRTAPSNGLSTYGGADLATDTGDVTIGGNLKLTREKGLLWDYTPNTGHGGYIAHPGGGMYRTSTGSHTGALTITIPSGGGPADMISFWVDVFDYVSYESQSFYIAGYVYQTAGSNEWVNETAMMLTPKENHARTVRFGHNGTNHVVYIGELADTWSYPQVTVRNVQVGFNSDVDTYDDNWDISFEASAFANVDATYSGADTLPTAGKIKMKDGAGKFVHNTTSSRDKIRVWNSSNYAIGMQSGNNYGGLANEYAMTFNMNDQSSRGFLWCDDGHGLSAGAMALTTNGKLTVAHSMRLGYGESDTTTPGATYRLDVSGNSLVTGTMFASKLQTDSGNLILSGGGWGMNFYIDTDANSGDNYNFYSDNALRHILGGDGNVTFGKVANPTLSIMNTATAAGSGPTLEFGHDQGGGARAGAISTYLTDGSVANRTSLLRFWHTQANADILKLQLGDNYVRQYQKGDASDYLETIVNDDHAEFHVASGNYVKISTDSGYVNIGAQNPSWAHFYTDRPGWYFDKGPTSGNGVFQSYSGQDLSLRRSQGTNDRIDISTSAHQFYMGGTRMLSVKSDGNIELRSDGSSQGASIQRVGGIQFTWDRDSYGTDNVHSIRSDSDNLIISSYDDVTINLDSNNNDASETFDIRRHASSLTGGELLFQISGSGTSYTMGASQVGNGSAAAPSLSFYNDPDLGFYRNGANNMRFSAGNSIRGTWNGDGLVLNGGSLGVNVAVSTAADGRIDAGNDIVAYSSDKRLKENIRPINNALDKVNKLSGFIYNWNKLANEQAGFDMEEDLVGVYAQDVEEVLPEAVKLAPFDNDGEDNSKSGENYLTVQYEKMVPLLIEAIKEQQKQINKLKEKLNG